MDYEFQADDARRFAHYLGAKARERNGELVFKHCPYCKGSGKGNEDTFSINLDMGVFKCLRSSCGAQGNMLTLAKDFDFRINNDIYEYWHRATFVKTFPLPREPAEPTTMAVRYLLNRGISREVINRYTIRAKRDSDNVIAFLFTDIDNKVKFVKYRKTDYSPERDGGYKEWTEKGMKPILYGMRECEDFSRLVITEGQIDSLSVATAGIKNAVSVPTGARGFTWVPRCWDWVSKFEKIVVFGDCENGGVTLYDEIKQRWKEKVWRVRAGDYLGCKDANEILQKHGAGQVVRCVENAEKPPVASVIEVADVEDVDIFSMQKLRTNIKDLDNLLYGGLPFGGITLITGKAGRGKSTLASQLLVSALAQGYKVFAYSGELPNYLFRSWVDFQIAGRDCVTEGTNRWGDKSYTITKKNRAMIADWYRGRFWLYDNSVAAKDEEENIVKIAEKTVKEYGVDVVLLDNLMTALDLSPTVSPDKYEKQSKFVKALTRLALDNNILVILVAHKRKNGYGGNENDEVAGSSDIANLAMITISYDTGKDIQDDERMLKVSKNRLFGKTNEKGWVMQFDEKTKRIYNEKDGDLDCGWDDGTADVAPEETPFG